ncbi:hypothetical protein RBA41_24700 [Massilia sp. CCM 9210]|uniref:hypothetical protein n=1 Tax=Massilia scottii TaxID=3057166 RepID=UPI0027968F61|nr:hypothetical protein [Massilia sp. CCM 9210]MDQ1816502.1 hypothetical protein [Massilia sp. CCM 9210]
MNKVSLMIFVTVALPVGWLLTQVEWPKTINIHKKNISSEIFSEPGKKIASFPINDDNTCSSTKTPLLVPLKLRNVLINDQLETAQTDSFLSPASIIQKAENGDSIAAIALFQMISSCYPTPKNLVDTRIAPPKGCPQLDRKYIENRFSLLERAALNNDLAAQTTYAINAPAFAKNFMQSGTNDSTWEAQRLKENAEKFAVAAAAAGSREATYFLARAYTDGTFGSRDLAASYAYTLPLQRQEPSNKMDEQIEYLKNNITSQQRKKAELLISGCVAPTDGTTLNNPFSSQP